MTTETVTRQEMAEALRRGAERKEGAMADLASGLLKLLGLEPAADVAKPPAVREINLWRPRPESRSHLQYIFLVKALCSPPVPTGEAKPPPDIIAEMRTKRRTRSLRQLGCEYGVSHESVRLALLSGD